MSITLSPLCAEVLEGVRESLQHLQQIDSSSHSSPLQQNLLLSLVRAVVDNNNIGNDSSAPAVRRIAAAVFKEALIAASEAEPTTRLAAVLPLIPHVAAAAASVDNASLQSTIIHDLFLSLLRLYLKNNSKLYALTLRTLTPLYLKTDGALEDLEALLRSRQETNLLLPPYSAAVLAPIFDNNKKQVVDWNQVLITNNSSSSSLSPVWTTVAAASSEPIAASPELILQVSEALLDTRNSRLQKHALFLLQKIKKSSCSNNGRSHLGVVTLAAADQLSLFTSLYTTLDEKQFHIISPVLRSVLPQLFQTSRTDYYVIVLVKLLAHDNRALVREGLTNSLALGQHLQIESAAAEEYLQFLKRWVVPVVKTQIGWVLINDNSAREFFKQVDEFAKSLEAVAAAESSSAAVLHLLLDVLTDEGTSQGPATIFFVVSVLYNVVRDLAADIRVSVEAAVSLLRKISLCLRSCLRTLEPFLLTRVTGMLLEVVFALAHSPAAAVVTAEVICDLIAVLAQSSVVRDHREVIARIGRKLDSDMLKKSAANHRGAVRLRLCCSRSGDQQNAVIDDLIRNSSGAVLIDAVNIFGISLTESQLEVIRRRSSSNNEFLQVVAAAAAAAAVVVDSSDKSKKILKKIIDDVALEESSSDSCGGDDLEVTWRLASLQLKTGDGNDIEKAKSLLLSLFLERESPSSAGRTFVMRLFPLQMETLRNVLSSAALEESEVASVLEKTMELLDSVGGTSGEGLVPAMTLFLAAARLKFFSSSSSSSSCRLLRNFAETAWKMLQEARRSDAFASGLNTFAALILHDSGLIEKYAPEVLKLGETVLTAPLSLVTALEQEEWDDCSSSSSVLIAPLFVRLIVDGPPLPKAARAVHAIVQEVIISQEDSSSSNSLVTPPLACMSGPISRYRAVMLLLEKKNSSSRISSGGILVDAVVLGLLVVEAEEAGRYFENSATHRRKQRALQGVLALLPVVSKDVRMEVVRSLLMTLTRDSPQPSVRYLAEWAIATVLAKERSIWRSAFFDVAKKSWRSGGRAGFGSIFASLALQTWKILKLEVIANDDDLGSLERWLTLTLPLLCELILGNHKTVRVYAQVVFEVMFNEATEIGLEVVKFVQMFESLEDSKSWLSGNARKILDATANDFYIHKFHPLQHLQMQVVFQLLPLVAGVSSDEVVVSSSWTSKCGAAPKDVEDMYRTAAAASNSCWHLRNVHSGVNSCTAEDNSSTTFQRKMMMTVAPPLPLDPDEELMIPLERTSLMLKTNNSSSLIVVGSLLERVPNLGGLCRTCEIFGVATFVVPSLNVLGDANFTSLAVSAHNWVNVVAVSPQQVENFVVAMATEEGYEVVALEQTSKSTEINLFTFPKRTLLILGNEKTGVPASLLSKVDHCVEIPQVGVIRSLNVHVSGAIAIYSFANQHTINRQRGGGAKGT